MILTDKQWQESDLYLSDVAIVGAGAAGISLALELSSLGISVILLEGGQENYTTESQDSYKGSFTARDLPYGLYASRLRFLGGSTNCWGAGCGELDQEDFISRDWAPLSGWPIEKADLNPWYDKAGDFLQLDMDRIRNPSKEKAFLFIKGLIPRSLVSTKIQRFASEFQSDFLEDKNLTLLTGANFYEMTRDSFENTVDALKVRSESGAITAIKAKYYVLACGGIENPRLLLNTTTDKYGAIGNQFDNVGRYFSDHPIAPCATFIDPSGAASREDMNAYSVLAKQQEQAILPFYKLPFEIQKKHKTLNVAMQVVEQEKPLTSVENAAWRLKKFYTAPDSYSIQFDDIAKVLANPLQLLESYKAKSSHKGRLALRFQIEQLPSASNRVSLGSKVDSHGLYRANLHWEFSDIERRTVDVAIAYTAQVLQSAKLGSLHIDEQLLADRFHLPVDLRGGQHHCGTTRMSGNEEEGVVDKNLKVFGSENVFICGSSVFPTNGWVNPTFTIIALSLRLAAHLKKIV